MRVLSRIEMASLRKPGPEDSALFSEDSGIGAESESLAGSERRLRRESYFGEDDDNDDDHDDDDDDEQIGSCMNAGAKTKVVCSPKTSRRQWTDEERSPRRPQTTAPTRKAAVKKTPVSKERRSQSEESLRSKAEDPTLLELERTQKDLDQRLQRMARRKHEDYPTETKSRNLTSTISSKNRKHPSLQKNSNSQLIDDKAVLTRRNSKKLEAASVVEDDKLKDKKTSKGPMKATPPPSPPASPRPPSGLYRGRKSVKRLIDTFSQGIEDLEVPKRVRKCGVPVLPGLGNVEAVLSTGITSCRPDSSSASQMSKWKQTRERKRIPCTSKRGRSYT
ncbi:hypothetical protein F7725_007737 [Dissostichus mawsoni]|uniref:Uncharacterized protein n=1 Tax=Dissostichus mawsoni TaxID=36200 RepID=A0A7J5Y575_DISMA|nr:hypothetical protein F7725_007737 [Dissostichus mawsoni]